MTRSGNNSSEKGQRISRAIIGKEPKHKSRARGTRRVKPRRRQDPIAPPTPAVVAARTELREWLAGGRLRRADPLMVTSKLLAVAVREARTFLDPSALTMALVAIGMTPETMSEDDLITCIENLLIDVPGVPE
ncbi:MAG: hypothetical protein MIN69_00955 [Methylorubrum extorquens]|jgi:hypothetical protein|uniref:hypothetical protein n=1 Tax=Methylorubrum TaxID=2282523 RepID=UPI002FEE4516